tara:strand:- start:12554 stop:14560 length:2007 start_codon:yes stop_codon:yes gene_type:complete
MRRQVSENRAIRHRSETKRLRDTAGGCVQNVTYTKEAKPIPETQSNASIDVNTRLARALRSVRDLDMPAAVPLAPPQSAINAPPLPPPQSLKRAPLPPAGGAVSLNEENARFARRLVSARFDYSEYEARGLITTFGYILRAKASGEDWTLRAPDSLAYLQAFMMDKFAAEIAVENSNRRREGTAAVPDFTAATVDRFLGEQIADEVASVIANNSAYTIRLQTTIAGAAAFETANLTALLERVNAINFERRGTEISPDDQERFDKVQQQQTREKTTARGLRAKKVQQFCVQECDKFEPHIAAPECMVRCTTEPTPDVPNEAYACKDPKDMACAELQPFTTDRLSQEARRETEGYEKIREGSAPQVALRVTTPLYYTRKPTEACRGNYVADGDTRCRLDITQPGYATLGRLYVRACLKRHGCDPDETDNSDAVQRALCEAACVPPKLVVPTENGATVAESGNLETAFNTEGLDPAPPTSSLRSDAGIRSLTRTRKRHVQSSMLTASDACETNCNNINTNIPFVGIPNQQESMRAHCQQVCARDPYKTSQRCPADSAECLERETDPAVIRDFSRKEVIKLAGNLGLGVGAVTANPALLAAAAASRFGGDTAYDAVTRRARGAYNYARAGVDRVTRNVKNAARSLTAGEEPTNSFDNAPLMPGKKMGRSQKR